MISLNYKKQLLISGVLFTLHNIEESIGFAHFQYPTDFSFPIRPQTPEVMILSIISITIIAWLLLLWAFRKSDYIKRDILIVLVSVFFINALFPHIVATLYLKRYFPAVITAILLYLPYSVWLFPKLYRLSPSKKHFFKIMVFGLLISILLVILLLVISNLIIKS